MQELEMVFWYWWVLAIGFLLIEIIISGFFFLWLAVSAFVVGILVFIFVGAGLNSQILLFSILAVSSVIGWRKYAKKRKQTISDHPTLNQRGAEYIGKSFKLQEPIVNGQGKIKVDDIIWKVQGQDCTVDSRVKVIAVNGTIFHVEKCD